MDEARRRRASTTTIRRNVKPPDPADHLPRSQRRGRGASSRGHRHDPSLSGWRSRVPPAILSRQVLDVQIGRRRARLAELEAEMIAACEAAALGTRPQTSATSDARALGSDDVAPLPRRSHAAGGDIRPAHTPSPPGNRPARTVDDTVDRCMIGRQTLCPPRSVLCIRVMGLGGSICGAPAGAAVCCWPHMKEGAEDETLRWCCTTAGTKSRTAPPRHGALRRLNGGHLHGGGLESATALGAVDASNGFQVSPVMSA